MTLSGRLKSSGSSALWSILALLAVALLFGGGGAEGPANNGIIYAASVLVLLVLTAAHASGARPLPREAAVPLSLLAAAFLIAAIQLVPLPPGIWRGLPGRELAISSLSLVGAQHDWRPLSLDPEATRRAIAALLLPAAMTVATLGSTIREASILLRVILAGASFTAVLGVIQMAARFPDKLMPYGGLADLPTGVFANINHQAIFLVIAIVCVGLVVRLDQPSGGTPRRKLHPVWLLLPFLAIVVLATQSRAGSILLVPAVAASLVVGLGRTSRLIWLAALAGLALLVLLVAASGMRDGLFAAAQELFTDPRRAAILPDVLFTMRQYWPWGSGLGTFVPAFAANENLDLAGHEFVNHAHNDLLELAIETGIAGTALMLLAVVAVVARLIALHRQNRPSERRRAAAWAGSFILSLLLLHSAVDYPLRMASIAAVAGVAFGLVFAPLPDRPAGRPDGKLSKWTLAAAAILALICAAQIVRIFVAQAAVRNGDGAASAAVRPQNGAGMALAAEEELAARRNASAHSLATRAIVRSPLSSRAVRSLAIANDLQGRGGMEAWRVASAMGWRDGPTQYWSMQQALANKEYETAAIRADAFLRTAYEGLRDRVGAVRILAANDPFRREFVRRLELSPPWKPAFFNVWTDTPSPEVDGVTAVLQDLSDRTSRPTVADAARTLRVLIVRKQYADAVSLYRAITGSGAAASMNNLAFDRPRESYIDQRNPFDWAFRSKAGSITSVEQSDNRRVLFVGTDGRERHRPVARFIALQPGTYRLGYAMRGRPDAPDIFEVALYCAEGMQRIASSPTQPLRGEGFEPREVRFSVPEACPMVVLAVESDWADRPSEAEFADFSLART